MGIRIKDSEDHAFMGEDIMGEILDEEERKWKDTQQTVRDMIVRELHAHAAKTEKDAIKLFLDGDLSGFHKYVDFSKGFRTTASYLDGVSSC